MAIRPRSSAEIERALAGKGFTPAERRATLERLAGWGYVDDERFARDRAAALLRQGRYGARAVIQKLCAHGLSAELSRRATEQAAAEVGHEPRSAARAILEARGLGGRALDQKEVARAARLLLGRGFAASVVHSVIRSAALDPLAEAD